MNAPRTAYVVLVAGLLLCQFGCHRVRLLGDTAVGAYWLDRSPKLAALSPVARETLELKRNRTFSQEIVLRGGERFRATGNWRSERIADKKVDEGLHVVDAVWITLEGLIRFDGGEVTRVTNSFHEVHRVGTDALWSYDGKNSLHFRRPS